MIEREHEKLFPCTRNTFLTLCFSLFKRNHAEERNSKERHCISIISLFRKASIQTKQLQWKAKISPSEYLFKTKFDAEESKSQLRNYNSMCFSFFKYTKTNHNHKAEPINHKFFILIILSFGPGKEATVENNTLERYVF